MSPIGDPRARKFTFVLTDSERDMLEALAASEQRTSSDWIRVKVRECYQAKFGDRAKKKAKK